MEDTILKLLIRGAIQGTGSFLAGELLKKIFTKPETKQLLDDLIYSINPFVNNLKDDLGSNLEPIVRDQELLDKYTEQVLIESQKVVVIRKQTNDFLRSILIQDWFHLCIFLRKAGLLVEAETFYLGYKNTLAKNSFYLARWLSDLALLYGDMNRVNERINYFKQSIRIFEKLSKSRSFKKNQSEQENYALTVSYFADTYVDQQEYKQAISLYKKAQSIMPFNSARRYQIEIMLLELHIDRLQFGRAEKIITKLNSYYRKSYKDIYYVYFLSFAADLYGKQKQYELSENKMVELQEFVKNPSINLELRQTEVAKLNAKIGDYYAKRRNPDLLKALEYTNKSLTSLKTIFHYDLNNTLLVQVEEMKQEIETRMTCSNVS